MRFRKVSTFVCIIVAAVMGVATAVFGGIVLAQNGTLSGQDTKLDKMASKIEEFGSMDDFLTLQNQLNAIQTVNNNKKVLSRIFGVMSMLLPKGGDRVTLSKVSISMEENTVTMEGQANAGVAPFYDYRVLESFKKGAELTKYDYGRYVDAEGNEIPSRCMVEAKNDGSTYVEANGSIYAYQMVGKDGCDAKLKELKDALSELTESSSTSDDDDDETTNSSSSSSSSNSTSSSNSSTSGTSNSTSTSTNSALSDAAVLRTKQAEVYAEYPDVKKNWFDRWLTENSLYRYSDLSGREEDIEAAYQNYYNNLSDEEKEIIDKELESGVDKRDVDFRKIYRTPQFTEWLKETWEDESGKKQEEARMTLGGDISNYPHFDSQCISYSGENSTVDGKNVVVWTTSNDCMLLSSEMNILESSNGKDSSGELVLRFKATIIIDDTVLSFQNKHLLAIGPDGQNVTDSYRQIEGMFEEEAADCNTAGVICTEAE